MALSLQEQLLQAGLSDKSKARKARQEKHKKIKGKKNSAPEKDEAQLAVEAAALAKREKDRALETEQKKRRLEKEIQAQVVDLVKSNAQVRGKGDIVLNFTDNNLVKRMYVDKATHALVTQGRLSVVSIVKDIYELVPSPVADKISQRMPDVIVYQASENLEEKASSTDDDWYADYDIPDDLVW